MLTKIKKTSEGFTIVEVMIVLAIAGMILLAVLLVVPALNRTARNNRRRTDVSAILGAVNDYISNNSGALPPDKAAITDLTQLGFYDETNEVNYSAPSTSAVTAIPGTDANVVYIRNFAKCNGNTIATSGATRRNVAVFFQVESGGAPLQQCQES